MGNSLRGYFGNLCGTEDSKRALAESCEEKQPRPKQTSTQGDEVHETEPIVEKEKGPPGTEQKTDADNKVVEEQPSEVGEPSKGDESPLKPTSNKKTMLSSTLNLSSPKFESFGIGELDQKFESAQSIFSTFLDSVATFRVAVSEFTKLYKKKDFEPAFSAYREGTDVDEKDKRPGDENASLMKSEETKQAGEHLKAARNQYPIIDKHISETTAKLDNLIQDINNINIKDYVRDEMADKSFVSKVSVPGKYKRNSKTLKKKRATIDEVSSELKEWYKLTAPVDNRDSQSVKPDILGDVTELKQSPGASRRHQPTEIEQHDGLDVSTEVRSDQDLDVSVNNVTETCVTEETGEPKEQDKPAVQEQVPIGESTHVGDHDDTQDIHTSDVIVLDNIIPKEEEEIVVVEVASHVEEVPPSEETSHVGEEGHVDGYVSTEEANTSQDIEPMEPEKETAAKIDRAKSPVVAETPVPPQQPEDTPVAAVSTEEEKATIDERVDDVEAPPSPDKVAKAEETDEVGTLPAVPGSSRLERKISSTSADIEEGKLVDYGSYLVLNEDSELLKRSRSLDSLTSRGSRASMSRLGSFEIVTNFEIKVAEQAETERAQEISQNSV